MRSKTPLVLMEQVLMILVFALAAALCLQTFAFSDALSLRHENRDRAVLEAQNAAELLKSCGGDYAAAALLGGGTGSENAWEIAYDEAWEQTQGEAAFLLRSTPAEQETALLGGAQISVCNAQGEVLCSLPVAWQEVRADG